MDPVSGEEFWEHGASDGESIDGDEEIDFKNEASTSPHSADGKHNVLSSSSAGGGGGARRKSPAGSSLQKRRRVTRACDECRRKKIKCDGKQPCTHCTVYSYDCTYDQPSNRRRNPAPQYVENLEHRVHTAETLLHILIPNLDLTDPGIAVAVAQGYIPGAPGKGGPGSTAAAAAAAMGQDAQQRVAQQAALFGAANPTGAASLPQQKQQQQQRQQQQQGTDSVQADANIESMLRATAQLDLDETGNWGYHGHSSGLSFVRRMREQLGDLMGPDTSSSPFVKSRPLSESAGLESPRSTSAAGGGPGQPESPLAPSVAESMMASQSPILSELPPKAAAREICTYAVEDAAALLRVVHRPSFWASFERLYSTPPEQYANEDQKFLPLFYSAMALGSLFGKDEQAGPGDETYENAIHEGITYFRTARQLMDIADCRGIVSIQAVLFMTLFLQSSAKLSQCYAYVGVALRSALRMGLHRSHGNRFDPLESEIRKRIFWVVRKMDIYVGAMLGLPLTLSDDDIDQDFPAEVDDEYLTAEGILPMPEGQVSLMTAFNAHTRLVQILYKIVRYIYPIKMSSSEDKSYSVPFSAIREIESDLESWKQQLPPILTPCPAPERYARTQQLLRLTYAHAQVMLYRPFLHFVAHNKRNAPMDTRAYACGASYVNVSRNIVHIQTQMKQKGLLNGAFWFTQYTAFFAILSLVYFAAENPDATATEGVIKDALEGKEVLASLARRSMAADRCTATLDIVFSRLPDWMRNGHPNPIMSRKRQYNVDPQYASWQQANQQMKKSGGVSGAPAVRSHTDVTASAADMSMQGLNSQRANTFPIPASLNIPATDSWSQSGGSSTVGPQTPNTANDFASAGYMPYTSQAGMSSNGGMQGQFMLPPDFNYATNNPALADISGMFPAADEPFGYPHQPLTTFENQQMFAAAKNISNGNNSRGGGANAAGNFLNTTSQPFDSMGSGVATSSPLSGAPGSRGGVSGAQREDGLEAQFFALPPYMDRQQQQLAQQQQMYAGTGTGSPDMPSPVGAAGSGPWGHAQHQQQQQQGRQLHGQHPQQQHAQHPFQGHQTQQHPNMSAFQGGPVDLGNQINIQDIFGGNEWNPMLMTGFQTQ